MSEYTSLESINLSGSDISPASSVMGDEEERVIKRNLTLLVLFICLMCIVISVINLYLYTIYRN